MLVNFMYSGILISWYFNDTSEGDQYLVWHVGLVFLCSSRLPEDGTPVQKHVGISLVMSCVWWSLILFVLLSAFVGWYVKYKNMHGMSNKI